MDDLRTGLERLSERARPAPDAFVRLERARRHRERRRRVEAGILALLLAVAGTLGVIAAFGGSNEPRIAGGTSPSFTALWPESTYEDALAAQARVDAMVGARAMRTSAESTAAAFARDVLGWPEIAVAVQAGDVDGDGPVAAAVSTPPAWCPSPPVPACLPKSASITLARLVRSGPSGIWSVVAVRSDALDFALVPGQEVRVGEYVAIPTSLDEGTDVAVGVAGTGSCSGFNEETARVLGGYLVLPVRGVAEDCPGYVYALTPRTRAGQVEAGRIMFADGGPGPGAPYTIESIAAVPVRFVAAGGGPPPSVAPNTSDVADVICDGTTTTVLTPEVAAQADGVHLRVTNTSSIDLSLQFEGIGGEDAPLGEREVVWPLAPGGVELRCLDPQVDAGSSVGYQTLQVVDPEGLFVPSELSCPGGVSTLNSDYPEGWTGYRGDPVDAVETLLTGLQEGDEVDRAGYQESDVPVVRVVRDGVVVARIILFSDGDGGWLLSSLERCDEPGTVFGWGDEAVKSYPRGWFEWCPAPPFLEPGSDWEQAATDAAVRFAEAYAAGDRQAVAALTDPSVPPGAELDVVLADGTVHGAGGAGAGGNGIAGFSCGADVEDHTVTVTIDDGTSSASADFTVFLVLREDGWKIWGVY